MKKIQVFIDSDIILRHFVLSNVFEKLSAHFKLQFVFPKHSRVNAPLESLGLEDYKIIDVDIPRVNRMRDIIKVKGIRAAKKNPKYHFLLDIWRGILAPETYDRLDKLSPLWRYLIMLVKHKLTKTIYKEMDEVINDFGPDLLIHPSTLEGLFITDLISLKKKHDIPLLVLMNSWDNPSTKSTLDGLPDYLAVWGEQTKHHAVEFMSMPQGRILKWGAAQFEVYKQPARFNRKDYCQKNQLDINKKIILYAGSSKSVNEIEHLKTLEIAIESGEIQNAQVLFRPHPWRTVVSGEDNFFSISWKHVKMDLSMIDVYKKITEVEKNTGINLTSYEDTRDTLKNVDMLICNVSTILLEAAFVGLPVMSMVSDQEIIENDFLRVTHQALYIKELIEVLEIPRCKNPESLPSICSKVLENSDDLKYRKSLKEKTSYFVEPAPKSYSESLDLFVSNLLK